MKKFFSLPVLPIRTGHSGGKTNLTANFSCSFNVVKENLETVGFHFATWPNCNILEIYNRSNS